MAHDGEHDGAEAHDDASEGPASAAGLARLRAANQAGELHGSRLRPGDAVGSTPWVVVAGPIRGAFGDVYSARHRHQPGWSAAIKVLRGDPIDPEVLALFEREARLLEQARSPHVVEVLGYDVLPGGRPLLVMELLEGETLGRRLEHASLSPPALRRLARELVQGLAALHRAGVIHRDIKPENLFLVEPTEGDRPPAAGRERPAAGEQWSLKIIDLGLATPAIATRSHVVGTPAYGAPEQLLGRAKASACGDVYATAVVLYEAIAGQHPFASGPRPRPLDRVRPEVPRSLARALARAMHEDPARRTPSAERLGEELEAGFSAWLDPRPRRWRRRLVIAGVVPASVIVTTLAFRLAAGPCGRIDAARQACVTPGTFTMGTANVEPFVDACVAAFTVEEPPERIRGACRDRLEREREHHREHTLVEPFALDRQEVTTDELVAWLAGARLERAGEHLVDASNGMPLLRLLDGVHAWDADGLRVDPAWSGNAPAMGVTWYGADAYCRARGQRLPSEIEWEFAARGPGSRPPPADDAPDCEALVYGRSSGAGFTAPCSGRDLVADATVRYGTDDVGGILHLGGNVAEWVDASPTTKGLRVMKGGSFMQPAVFARPAARALLTPHVGSADFGFRCAADASRWPW